MAMEQKANDEVPNKAEERKKRAALRRKKLAERMANENLKIFKTDDIVSSRGQYGYIKGYKLIDTNWKT